MPNAVRSWSAHLSLRYKLCQLLPRLRLSLRLPADKLLLQKLDFCVQKLLCREKDKDVVATIRKVTPPRDRCRSGAGPGLEPLYQP